MTRDRFPIRSLAILLLAVQLQACGAVWRSYPAERGPLGRQLPRTMRLHLDGDSTLVLDRAVLRSDSIVGLRAAPAQPDTVAVALADIRRLELRTTGNAEKELGTRPPRRSRGGWCPWVWRLVSSSCSSSSWRRSRSEPPG